MTVGKHQGFTLVELLVVIAIIALLMSILMPAIQQVRKTTKAVICQANLRQWGIVTTMYTTDSKGSFFEGLRSSNYPGSIERQWIEALRPYYVNPDLRLWPMAATLRNPMEGDWDVGIHNTYGLKNKAWGAFPAAYHGRKGVYGSYGWNEWICNTTTVSDDRPLSHFWKNTGAKGTTNVPVIADAVWWEGWPRCDSDYYEPLPDWEDEPGGGQFASSRNILFFLTNRHSGFINSLFLDFSVRKVGLKELYKLKWNRYFDINTAPYTIAGNGGDKVACANAWDAGASWLRNYPEY